MTPTGKKATLILDGKNYELPVFVGTENEYAIDITNLRKETGYITLDSGYGNTGACESAITYIDGEKGILRHRGYAIEELAEHSTFVEVSFLLIHGHLPTEKELQRYSESLTSGSMIHEDLHSFFTGFPTGAHPMLVLSTMVSALSSYYPELAKPNISDSEIYDVSAKLLSKVRTIAAFSHKKTVGQPFVYPRGDLKYVPNFLNMMFSTPLQEYEMDPDIVRAMQVLFMLHADHEQNCSTSTVRLVGSSHANLFASVAAGIFALWGPLHGGANQAVIEQLEKIHSEGLTFEKVIARAKDPNDNFRLMGFGHRVYKNFDPRSRIIKNLCTKVLAKMGQNDPLLEIALKLEEVALQDEYFIERKLFPNVDFYSGIIFRAIGIPLAMFPVMFSIGRLPGWIAHWKEMRESRDFKIGRPRQIYTGETQRSYMPIESRG